MRILVLTYEFPPVGGGGGRAAQDICQGLAKRGHQVLVITAHLKGLPHQETIHGVEVIRVTSARRVAYKAGLIPMAGFVISGMWKSWRIVNEWKPDVIHVHFAVPTGPVAWVLSRWKGIPYVLTAHLGDVPGGVPEKTEGWFPWIYPFTPPIWHRAARVVAVSEHTRQLALRYYPVKMQVIPNGVDLKALDPGPIQTGFPPRLIFAGRFMQQKNPLQLVRTLSSLQDLQWQCVMLGDGPLREEIKLAISRCGLEERFQLLGWVAPEEVISWFARSDVLFMPSLSEGLPVAGVQALAMGLAIVASRVGGFVDLVEPGENGYLINADDTESYSIVLRELIENPVKLQSFKEASRLKANCFDIEKVVDAYEDIMMDVINGK